VYSPNAQGVSAKAPCFVIALMLMRPCTSELRQILYRLPELCQKVNWSCAAREKYALSFFSFCCIFYLVCLWARGIKQILDSTEIQWQFHFWGFSFFDQCNKQGHISPHWTFCKQYTSLHRKCGVIIVLHYNFQIWPCLLCLKVRQSIDNVALSSDYHI
jgi:hypothetical protein